MGESSTWSPKMLVRLNSLLQGIFCDLQRACQSLIIVFRYLDRRQGRGRNLGM